MHRRRRSIRLQGHDYASAGAYFVTICTYRREHLFGEIRNGRMVLNEFGDAVWWEWYKTEHVRPEVELDAFVVMPNHVHGIVMINVGPSAVGAQRAAPLQNNVAKGSLGAIVRAFKSAATKRVNEVRRTPGLPVWQRNYYERIIRDEGELEALRCYVRHNPLGWDTDAENA